MPRPRNTAQLQQLVVMHLLLAKEDPMNPCLSYARVKTADYWLERFTRLEDRSDHSVLKFLLDELASYSEEYV